MEALKTNSKNFQDLSSLSFNYSRLFSIFYAVVIFGGVYILSKKRKVEKSRWLFMSEKDVDFLAERYMFFFTTECESNKKIEIPLELVRDTRKSV